jgi:Ca-activated chloride channel family protein
MSGLAEIALLRPWWLAAVPLALALWLVRRRRAAGLGGWTRAVDPHLMAALTALGRVRAGSARGLAPAALTAALLAVALAGPALPARQLEALRNLDGAALLVDLSPSVATEGPAAAAQTAARLALAQAPGRGVALTVYAGDAYAVSPFTVDHEVLARTVGVLEAGLVPDAGTRPERALRLAAEQFRAAGILAGDVVVITDGGGIGPQALAAAGDIRAQGGRVHGLLVPAAPGAPEPDPAALAALAQAGGGVLASAADMGALGARLGAGFAERLRADGFAALALADWGRGLAALALVPALLMFGRRR